MACVYGEVICLTSDHFLHPVGANIIVTHNGQTIGHGTVTENNTFEIEIEDEVRGAVEITLGLHNAAEATALADGGDIYATLLFNGVHNYYG